MIKRSRLTFIGKNYTLEFREIEVFLLAAIGLTISLPVALAASKLVESFLFGMKPNDPLALTGAVLILTGAVTLAGYVPARRASRIDPTVALRHE